MAVLAHAVQHSLEDVVQGGGRLIQQDGGPGQEAVQVPVRPDLLLKVHQLHVLFTGQRIQTRQPFICGRIKASMMVQLQTRSDIVFNRWQMRGPRQGRCCERRSADLKGVGGKRATRLSEKLSQGMTKTGNSSINSSETQPFPIVLIL